MHAPPWQTRHPMRANRSMVQCTRIVQLHNSSNRECYFTSIALRLPGRSRQVSSGKAPFSLNLGLPYSARSRFSRIEADARGLRRVVLPLRLRAGRLQPWPHSIRQRRKTRTAIFRRLHRICHSQNRPFRLERRAAPGLGRLQGHANSRRYPLRDLSRSRPCSVQNGPWLFGAAAALSAGRRFYVDRSFCRARPLRTQPPPRARRRSRGVGRNARAARAVFRRHARTRHVPARPVRDLDRHRGRHLHCNLRPCSGCKHP